MDWAVIPPSAPSSDRNGGSPPVAHRLNKLSMSAVCGADISDATLVSGSKLRGALTVCEECEQKRRQRLERRRRDEVWRRERMARDGYVPNAGPVGLGKRR